ncbi:MAG: GNAT family N-acetyltransferase, partial [Oscillospiraceae bacterium]
MKHCGTQPIETPRLLLRRFEREDQMAMYQNWAGSPIVTQYLTWEAHPSPEESLKVLCEWEKKYRKKNFYEWAIVLKEIGEPIGSIGAMPISGKSCFEVGYCIGQKWWGQGIAGEALKSV